jgi:hypothetical protein
MTDDPAKQAWQASVEIAGAPPLEEVRKGAGKLYRVVKWRNRIEYVGCSIAVVVFTYKFFTDTPTILHKLGMALLVAAFIYMPWQLHRRASAASPDTAGTMPIYVFLRDQLVRQRDAFRSIVGWYILPWLPGLALLWAGNGLDPEIEAAGPPIWARWLAIFGVAAFIAFYWWIHQRAARKIQLQIDSIEALMGEHG